jgi:tetratricopeptide (TPR) repeat protein
MPPPLFSSEQNVFLGKTANVTQFKMAYQQTDAGVSPDPKRRFPSASLAMIGLGALVIVCFAQTRHFDFINLDDSLYASENRHVRQGLSVKGVTWAFTNYDAAMWIPVTWISLMADTSFFGRGPEGHHITNVLLHLLNTLLLFAVFSKLTRSLSKSALLAALFAVHPLHVESVVWITERKDVLSTLFGLISIGCYVQYARTGRWVFYGLCFISLCLGLMSKALLVTWPFLFLLLDYWPLERFDAGKDEAFSLSIFLHRTWRLFLEKLPLLVPVVLLVFATVWGAHHRQAVIPTGDISLPTRVANALVSYVSYLVKTVWPVNLSVFYPYRDHQTLFWPALGAFLILALLTFAVLRGARKTPFLPVGWFWFLGTLVPVIGLVQVGDQAMADRFMYVPLIGLGIMAIWGIDHLWQRTGKGSGILLAVSVGLILCLSVATYRQAARWENSITLFQHALRIDPENALAHASLGSAFFESGDKQSAERHLRRALSINPARANVANNLGNILMDQGKLEEAEGMYRHSIALDPDWAAFRYNFGVFLFRSGRTEDAVSQFSEALRIDPKFAPVYNYMGIALRRLGKHEKALAFFREAVEIDPTFEAAKKNLEYERANAMR